MNTENQLPTHTKTRTNRIYTCTPTNTGGNQRNEK